MFSAELSPSTMANDELYLIELDAGNAPSLWELITEANLGDL